MLHSEGTILSLLCTPVICPGGEVAEDQGSLFGSGYLAEQWVAKQEQSTKTDHR